MKLSIIIPTYNEAATIGTIITAVRMVDFGEHTYEIIVVNDGSTDHTADIIAAQTPEVLTITHEQNAGKAAAIRSGLKAAQGEYVIIQDADLEYNPTDILRILEHAIHQQLVVVYGSRNMQQSGRGRFDYYWGGRAITLACNLLYGSNLTDEPTCYKLVQRSVLYDLNLHEEGFDFCPEVTSKLLRQGHTIPEIPISYHPRTVAAGKKIRYHHGARALWVLAKYRILPTRWW